ncbi:MAG: dihydrodipicolinate synthase family protein [Beijerinckiaceae bacterium]|jgi:4-hydroxy-tetrahydrodipicolinate synthase|nr:dihydrodipicolinate synthase family protein [Beijerinckiaceae bacterium]
MNKAGQGGKIGLNCALSTPFMSDGRIDLVRLVRQGRWVLDNGCDGFTLFGTTGEGASLSIHERYQALGAVAAAGMEMRAQVLAGVSAATIDDTVAQARAGYEMGCRGLLLAPPFYFANASDDGLFRFFSTVFERLGGDLRDVVLYHIPGMTRNGISIELTLRLAEAFPGAVIGIKDSNGDWAATQERLKALKGMQVLVGDERQLARAVQHGGAGSICGLANLAPDLLRPLVHEGKEEPRVNAMVEAILGYSFMSAVKAMIGEREGDPAWSVMRPPLDPLTAAQTRKLADTLASIRANGAEKAA